MSLEYRREARGYSVQYQNVVADIIRDIYRARDAGDVERYGERIWSLYLLLPEEVKASISRRVVERLGGELGIETGLPYRVIEAVDGYCGEETGRYEWGVSREEKMARCNSVRVRYYDILLDIVVSELLEHGILMMYVRGYFKGSNVPQGGG